MASIVQAEVMKAADFELLDTSSPPRFDAGDEEMLAFLELHGYCVVRSVLTADEVERAEDHLWALLTEKAGWARDGPSTWTNESFARDLGSPSTGIINKNGIGHSEAAWFVRTRKGVLDAFSAVWNDEDLIASFDGANVMRPWHRSGAEDNKTKGGWFHLDQGGGRLGRHAVQGLVSLKEANATTGGLVVIPGSHHEHTRIVEGTESDFVLVDGSDPVMKRAPPKLVCCGVGDLVLWDSRTVHCNSPATSLPVGPEDELLRAVFYVCMVPAAFCAETPEVLQARRVAYESRTTTGHWPHLWPEGVSDAEASGAQVLPAEETDDEDLARRRRLVVGLTPPAMVHESPADLLGTLAEQLGGEPHVRAVTALRLAGELEAAGEFQAAIREYRKAHLAWPALDSAVVGGAFGDTPEEVLEEAKAAGLL